MLASTDVGSLKFDQYTGTLVVLNTYTQSLLDRKRGLAGQADLRAVLAREDAADAASDRDEQGLWQTRADQDDMRMSQHRSPTPPAPPPPPYLHRARTVALRRMPQTCFPDVHILTNAAEHSNLKLGALLTRVAGGAGSRRARLTAGLDEGGAAISP